ncbi:MAG TPA: hypothetical protein VES73_13880 [Lamprocystis sp. (in: g-proteobacteria)]|nr:hypothetical protein [Lamprocystis sp. (in: g-proteobacteria)]
MPRFGAALAFALAMGLAAPSPAWAQASVNAPASLWTRNRLGGDWGGWRGALDQHGVGVTSGRPASTSNRLFADGVNVSLGLAWSCGVADRKSGAGITGTYSTAEKTD